MTRNGEEGGVKRCQGGRKHVKRTKDEDFKERQDGLEKMIFECYKPEHAAQFASTLKELDLYLESEYKGGKDTGHFFRELNPPMENA